MPVRALSIVILATLAAACTDGAREGADARRFLSPEQPAPDVYRGVFPCENCAGIDTTLWLRSDGTFFSRQQYADGIGSTATETPAHNLGRWEVDAAGILVLRGAGPERLFSVPNRDELLMLTQSTLEHRLSRDGARAFTDRIRIEGIAAVENGNAMISECLTGLVAPAAGGADLRRFVRQYRSLGFRGEPVFVELEGRFEWLADGRPRAFVIERFVAIKSSAAVTTRTCLGRWP